MVETPCPLAVVSPTAPITTVNCAPATALCRLCKCMNILCDSPGGIGASGQHSPNTCHDVTNSPVAGSKIPGQQTLSTLSEMSEESFLRKKVFVSLLPPNPANGGSNAISTNSKTSFSVSGTLRASSLNSDMVELANGTATIVVSVAGCSLLHWTMPA